MKKILHFTAIALFSSMCVQHLYAQGVASGSNDVPKLNAGFATKPSVTESPLGKSVTITIKNTAEKPVYVFAGPKEEIRNPQIQTLGGISFNKLYLKENEVVCLISTEKKPIACTVIKPGVTSVEVNSSGTTISSK